MSGYCDCACRDCFDIAISSDEGQAFCSDCEDAGCDGSGGSECCRDDAYGCDMSEGEPNEDDITTEDHSRFYQSGKLILVVDKDASVDEMWTALDAHMERTKWFPTVWFISDHGNAHVMTRK